MLFSSAFNKLIPPTRRAPDYAQYQGEVWIAGPASMMPAFFVHTTRGPVRIAARGTPPAPQPYQPQVGPWSAPVTPQQVTSPGATTQSWQPMQAQPVQAYQFLRAPTGMEAMTGPQFNPAQMLGLMP